MRLKEAYKRNQDLKLTRNVITNYGAVGDGVTDDTVAIQKGITECEANGWSLFLPAGDYCVTENGTNNYCLLVQKRLQFFGEGFKSNIVVDSAVDALTDIIYISTSTTVDNANLGFIFRDFRISPKSGTPGRHGVAIDITTRAFYNSIFEYIWISQLGGNAIRTLPNASPIADGFFTSTIRYCILYGGIYLDQAGDSIRIENNTITGDGIGVYVYLVDTGTSGGAHGLEITGNNITSSDGALSVVNAHAGAFTYNNVEVLSPGTLTNSACISIDGDASAPSSPKRGVKGFSVEYNFITSAAGNDTIYLGLCYDVMVSKNFVGREAGRHSYVVSSDSINAKLLWNVDALEEAVTTFLSDSGTNTLWMRNFAGVIESNQFVGGYQYPTSQTVTTGTVAAGGFAGCSDWNASHFQIQEVTGAPGFDVILDFSGLLIFNTLCWVGRYTGNPADNVQLEMYDYTAAAWRTIDLIVSNAADELRSYAIPEADTRFISSGVARVRFNHTTTGTASHNLYIDYLALLT